jgi:hypothetical protein
MYFIDCCRQRFLLCHRSLRRVRCMVGEEWEVTQWRHILSAAMDLATLVPTGIWPPFITVSIAMADFFMIEMADFFVIEMISSSGTVSLLVLTSRRSDFLGGGTLMTTGIRIPMPTMAIHLPIVMNQHRTVPTLHRMEPNIGVI